MGDDGAPMTRWQRWLHSLCVLMVAWALVELVGGSALWAAYAVDMPLLGSVGRDLVVPQTGAMAFLGALLNLAIGALGMRGAKNPRRITLFFWIVFADAMLTAWALASSISYGRCDLTSLVSGLFVIALAVCAWQVRGQTGYFDEHPGARTPRCASEGAGGCARHRDARHTEDARRLALGRSSGACEEREFLDEQVELGVA